ncbi:MAG: UvrD-helicase domain-containing protein [Anaerolineae bacterium]|nr:UvrD-helicase domain-containing protein [Anaerolineae bacterium]
MNTLHPRQREAIYTHDRNLIVVAGAGSGKTRVLVERYLALLDVHPDWALSSLVAITFTQKAAREMRDRVRHEIEQRINYTDPRNADLLRVWRERQAALSSARIGTIHSLCTAILRANAAEMGIDPAFAVLDEVESAILADEAVEEALAQMIEQDNPAAQLLLQYDPDVVRRELRANLFCDDDQLPAAVSPLDRWRADYDRVATSHISNWLNDAELTAARDWQPAQLPDSDDRILDQWQIVWDGRDRISRHPSAEMVLQVAAMWAKINLTGGSSKLWGGKETLDEAKRCLKLLREKSDQLLESIGDPISEIDERAAELLPLWRSAIVLVKETYTALKLERRALDFTDLEQMTRHLLLDFPQVRARYQDAEFKHILVDEFQDTNSAQRDIIYALADPQRPGSLFVVGDPKQSIYQFRGADVSVFNRVRSEILEWRGQQVNLNVSFRTHTMLVQGFNSIFGQVLGAAVQDRFEVAFDEPMEAHRQTEDQNAPTLEIIAIDKGNADDDRKHADDLRRWEAWELANRLRELIEHMQPIWDKSIERYRPMQYGDAAVLFRSTLSMPFVEDAFKAAGIPYLTIAGRGFYDRPEVWDVLNLLKALYNPSDNLSLASALRSPLFNLSDDVLLQLRIDHSGSLWSAISDNIEGDRIAFVREALHRLYGVAGRIPISELILRILNETGYLAVLAGLSDGTRKVANVQKLLEIARSSGRISLGEFVAYLQDLSDRETREGEALVESQDLVRLMTIHSSKGLEFPVVALFDCSWERRSNYPTLMLNADPELGAACVVVNVDGEKQQPFAYRRAVQQARKRETAEQKRLLYVALTRAQDYVIVSGRKDNGDHWLNQLIAALLSEPLPKDTGIKNLEWGNILIRVPNVQPDEGIFAAETEAETAWDGLSDAILIPPVDQQSGMTTTAGPILVPPIHPDSNTAMRELHARELAVLGEFKLDLGRFRGFLFNDAPAEISPATDANGTAKITGRQIGEIVHRALRYNRLPENTTTRELDKLLSIYAWEQGIIDPEMQQQTAVRCRELLAHIERSWIMDKLRRASQVYRELPFTYTYKTASSQHTINGVIDVAFFEDQQWHVLDYKTAWVGSTPQGESRRVALEDHAQRYYQQVGIYAAALENKLGQIPQVHIHYVRYAWTVSVPESAWKSALLQLDGDLQNVRAE